jgi:hypothetical protein
LSRTARALAAVYAGLAVGSAIATARAIAAPGGIVATDFSVFCTGWWLILRGQAHALYDAVAQTAAQHIVMRGALVVLDRWLREVVGATAGAVPLAFIAPRFAMFAVAVPFLRAIAHVAGSLNRQLVILIAVTVGVWRAGAWRTDARYRARRSFDAYSSFPPAARYDR